MNKNIARLVLAVQYDNEKTGNTCSVAASALAVLIMEKWHYSEQSDEMHRLVADWRIAEDYKSARALSAWLLAQ